MTSLQPFMYGSQEVRTITIDNEPWFVLNDLCAILEHTNSRMVAARLDEDDVSRTYVVDSRGRRQQTTIVNEGGMYEVIVRSDSPASKPFRRWVTHEVLPQIRKTGAYSATQLSEDEIVSQALQITAQRVKALEAKVKEDAPKVLFADSVAASQSTILIGELAKILRGNGVDIGQNRLYEQLREDGFLINRRGSDWNMPTQKAMDLGLFRIKETAISHSDGHISINKTTKVTGKGQEYFINRYLKETA